MVAQAKCRRHCLVVTAAVIVRVMNILPFNMVVTDFIGSGSIGSAQTPQLSAASYVERSNDWYKKGEFGRAMADLDIALSFDSRFAPAHVLRGLIRQRMGDSQGALEEFSRAIESQPRMVEAYHNRASVHLLSRNLSAAMGDVNQALKINPRFAAGYNKRGEVFHGLIQSTKGLISLKPAGLHSHSLSTNPNQG